MPKWTPLERPGATRRFRIAGNSRAVAKDCDLFPELVSPLKERLVTVFPKCHWKRRKDLPTLPHQLSPGKWTLGVIPIWRAPGVVVTEEGGRSKAPREGKTGRSWPRPFSRQRSCFSL